MRSTIGGDALEKKAAADVTTVASEHAGHGAPATSNCSGGHGAPLSRAAIRQKLHRAAALAKPSALFYPEPAFIDHPLRAVHLQWPKLRIDVEKDLTEVNRHRWIGKVNFL